MSMTETDHTSPGYALVAAEDVTSYGPAMQALTVKQRAFVIACMTSGRDNNTEAAREAGYSGDRRTLAAMGHKLANDERVQAAFLEMAMRRMNSSVIVATNELLSIMQSTTVEPKDRLKAIGMVLNRAGLHEKSEHRINVSHTIDEKDMVKRIKAMSEELGIDATKLLGSANIIEGDFKDVTPPKPDDDDWSALP